MSKSPLIHALIIADSNGNFLVDLIRNEKLEAARVSGFISALKMFGEETLGKIRDISINGLDIDMLVVSKYRLVMIAMMDSNLPGLDFREGCERALEIFNKIFHDKIENWNGSLDTFRDFKDLLQQQVDRYFKELEEHKEQQKREFLRFDDLKDSMIKYSKKFFEEEEEEEIIVMEEDKKEIKE
ncbi:MAG: hypothetical protein ACTSR8_22375 [Promethearchaeota archaeon]